MIEFLTRDENSRLLPGKKDTVTKNKVKEQRRVLTKSLRDSLRVQNGGRSGTFHILQAVCPSASILCHRAKGK